MPTARTVPYPQHMPDADIAKFRELVLADRGLQDRLRTPEERREYIEAAVRVARDNGVDITPDEVETALRNGRREWIERWI